MCRTLLFSVIIFLFYTQTSVAQVSDASVEGYIKDAVTGDTLISANIAFQVKKKGTSSNRIGYYSITNIQPGSDTLLCSYIGYELYRKEIKLKEGENVRLDVELVPENRDLGEIEVQASDLYKSISMVQVGNGLLENIPSIFDGDVFRSVQLLPGIKATSDYSSGLHIRGGSPDQTLILLDKTPIYNPGHFFGFLSTFNPDAIDDIYLYKGGYPAEYGGRLGSVLTLNNKAGNAEKNSGSLTTGLIASRASLEGPISKGSWMLSARRSTLEPLLAGLRQNYDDIPNRFHFYDVNGKLEFDASKKDKLSLAVYAGNDQVGFPFSYNSEFHLDYGNQVLSGNWTHIYSDNLTTAFSLTGARYFNFSEFELTDTNFERRNFINDFSAKWSLDYAASDNHYISAGIWAGISNIKLQDRLYGSKSFNSDIDNQYTSVYLQDEWRPAEKWKITPGIRVNYHSNGEFLRVEPRWSFEFMPNHRLRLQASYGHYNQFLTLNSNEAFSGFDVWLSSADGVPPASGDQIILGVKTIPFDDYGLDLEVYYRTMSDLFEMDPFLPDISGLAYDELFRTGEGYAYGFELFFRKSAGKFTGFIGYTLGYTWRKFPGYNLEVDSENQKARFYPPKYDRRHDINLVASYQFNSHWKITSSFSYASGQAYTKALGRYLIRELPWSNDHRNVVTVGKVNASRLPAYHSLDFSISRSGKFFNLGDSKLQLQLINVYSRRNVWFYNYYFEPNPAERAEINMLPFLPSLSYTIKF